MDRMLLLLELVVHGSGGEQFLLSLGLCDTSKWNMNIELQYP